MEIDNNSKVGNVSEGVRVGRSREVGIVGQITQKSGVGVDGKDGFVGWLYLLIS